MNDEVVARVMKRTILAILLTRASCDVLFDRYGLSLGGVAFTFGAGLNAVVIAIAAWLVLQRPGTVRPGVYAIWAPFLVLAAISIVHAPAYAASARTYLVLLSYAAMFYIPFHFTRTVGDYRRFIGVLMVSSIVPSLYGLVDIVRGGGGADDTRVASLFMHPNIFAFYLVLVIGVALFVRSSRSLAAPAWARRAVTMCVPLLLLLLLATKTRSAWLACALVCGIYAVGVDRRFFAGLLLVPLLFVFDPSVVERLSDLWAGPVVDDLRQLNEQVALNSYAWREVLWQSALPWIQQNPLGGYGLESFLHHSSTFFPLLDDGAGIDAHSVYVQLAFEVGVPGLVACVWLFVALFRSLARVMPHDRAGTIVVASLLVAYCIGAYSDNMLRYLSFNWYFWFLMGAFSAWIERRGTTITTRGGRASGVEREGGCGVFPDQDEVLTPAIRGTARRR